jgi:hypothetical protein
LRQTDVGKRPVVQLIESPSASSCVEPRLDEEQVAQEPAFGGWPGRKVAKVFCGNCEAHDLSPSTALL